MCVARRLIDSCAPDPAGADLPAVRLPLSLKADRGVSNDCQQ
jgi:hypothetical protein